MALGVTVGGTILLTAARALIDRHVGRRPPLAQARLNDFAAALIHRTSSAFLAALALMLAIATVQLPARVDRLARDVATIVCLVQVGLWASLAVREIVERRFVVATTGDGQREHQAVARMATLLVRLVLWSVLILVALDNLGINITALVTGLGVGGVAVALAVQNVLGDLFASVSILLDKPFVLGDFIVVDSFMGTIEQIGIKTTRVRSLDGEQIVFANSDLLKSRLRNYKTQRERRVVFRIGVVYETPPDKVAALPGVLRVIVEGQKPVRFDRAHFASYGESALLFEVVYYVLEPDYGLFMNIQQAINLEILRRLATDGIALAYPTRTMTTKA